jgi:hypothetical protein
MAYDHELDLYTSHVTAPDQLVMCFTLDGNRRAALAIE